MSVYFEDLAWRLMASASVVSRQVFGGMGQVETQFEKPRRVETGFETMQNLIHSSK